MSHPEAEAAYDAHAAALWVPGLLLLAGGSWLLRRAVQKRAPSS
jgi:hypothetical protein